MKNVFLLFCSFLLISCSDDLDDNPVFENFNLPISDGNNWVYEVDSEGIISEDILYISGDVLLNNKVYKKFETVNNPATGFYSSSLRNNGVRKLQNSLLLSGNLLIGSDLGLPLNLDINLDDFVIFNGNARFNDVLATKSGIVNETINEIPLTINYTLKSIKGENYTDFTSPNSDTYLNVKTMIIVLNISISASISGFNIPVMTNQDVLVSKQYIADGIGVVHTNTIFSYTISQLIANELSIPSTNTRVQNEFLLNYLIN